MTDDLDTTDRALLNRLQDDLPLDPRPFAALGQELDLTEAEVLARISRLRDTGYLTRFGPFYDAAALGGAFCLCAMEVPEDRYAAVTEQVNAHSEVAHNYARDHRLNMWFVMATESAEGIQATARRIEAETGLQVLLFPKEREFFIGFRVAA
ncbi:AsnC family transcriptional regulator [Fluviibacterium sp. DFM31]|uniref:siroheme decarboxylase n=1 Tax=Meridianimarinicoccus marinus TaxID=3231483 RepID=A0ABV3L9Y1_9RHOB